MAVKSAIALADRLFAPSDRPLVVPDTNALLFNPDLEKWRFSWAAEFVIALVPSVLSELDSHKINHRVDAVRGKSEKLIRQIKEYRRRAAHVNSKLTAGVPLVTGVSEILAIAIEPKMELSLPWLDVTSKDDRLLASVIEVMRIHPRSPVLLVTRDINLQNKAEFANVAFIEPPDPV